MKTLKERIEENVSIIPITGCWMWMGSLNDKGYARMRFNGSRRQYAHRLSYEAFTGKTIDKPEMDHLCRHPWCVNPNHVEPVTRSENQKRSPLKQRGVKRFSHCRRGHEFLPDNVYMQQGNRVCKKCILMRQWIRYHGGKV